MLLRLLRRLMLTVLLRLPAFLRRRRLLYMLLRRCRLLGSRTCLLRRCVLLRRMLLAAAFFLTIVLAFMPLRENNTHELAAKQQGSGRNSQFRSFHKSPVAITG